MSPTAIALLTYVAWTLLLLFGVAAIRSARVLNSSRAINSFSPSGADLEGFGQRVTRAHANCYENLPIAGAVMLYAIATGQDAVTNGLAYALVGARIAQSATHLISTSNAFVMIRFAFFGVQILILIFWLLKLLGVF